MVYSIINAAITNCYYIFFIYFDHNRYNNNMLNLHMVVYILIIIIQYYINS